MNSPLIGITVSRLARKHRREAGFLMTEYSSAIRDAGGSPLLIPYDFPISQLEGLCHVLGGVLLSGGGDIDPSLYQSAPDRFAANVTPQRDALEKSIALLAVKTNLPLLGICRGHQMLNVALGGTLYTDIDRQYKTPLLHSQPETMPPDYLAHEVEIASGSRLAGIISNQRVMVNSRHHQAIKDLAPNLSVSARASDGLIEAVELIEHSFCLGVQWHPEALVQMEAQRAIFSTFIAAASG